MVIGINAAAALKHPRTGIEEYTYQLVKHLTMLPEAREHRFLLYVPGTNTRISTNDTKNNYFDFFLPSNFEIKILRWPLPFLWTQIRLALEVFFRKTEVLFIPVHVLPFFHPKNSVVTIHGLEYEYFPRHYSFFRCWYLKRSTKRALKRARKIIAVSENTKQDLIKLYGTPAEKIEVVRHGVSVCHFGESQNLDPERSGCRVKPGMTMKVDEPYLLYLGRLETKKNVQGILEAYRILKEKDNVPHQLVLAGARGFGYKNLKFKIENYKLKIKELGYVGEEEKWQLLANADIFLFPSFCEGFGLPVLEAQTAGTPVITSNNSCLPEVAGKGALFVDPRRPEQIAEAAKSIIDDKNLRDKLRQLGYENVKRFGWEKCARETLNVLK